MPLAPPQRFRKTEGIHRQGLAANRPAATDVLPGTLYFSTDTFTLERSDGTTWSIYTGTGGGALTAHHTTHETGGSDPIAALAGSVITSGTVADARLSANVPLLNAANVFTQDQTVQKTIPRIGWYDGSQAVNSRLFRIVNANATLGFYALDDAVTTILATPLVLDRSGNAAIGAAIFENSRVTALGYWTNISFNAGDYTCSAGTWTVAGGGVTNSKYTLIGKTMIVAFNISGTLSSTPVRVSIALPFTSNGNGTAPFSFLLGGATAGTGIAQYTSGAVLNFYRDFTGSIPFAAGTIQVSVIMSIEMA
jgi:hypothetical protein